MKRKFAPKRADGLSPYVVTTRQWGRSYDRIEWASNLAAAKAHYGWTREHLTSVYVRRAKVEDMPGGAS